jgi:hypothetical protein
MSKGELSRYYDGLQDERSGCESRQRAGHISFFHCDHIGPGALAVSYPVQSGILSLVVKRPERGADHSPPSNVDVTNTGAMSQPQRIVTAD